jgi:glucose-6-phosphate isomerase
MSLPNISPIHTSSWNSLKNISRGYRNFSLNKAFAIDPERFQKYHVRHEGFLFDYSKNFMEKDVKSLLLDLAQECRLQEAVEAMFRGEAINRTENRSVLHVALRGSSDDTQIKDLVGARLSAMQAFVNKLHGNEIRGCSGHPIRHIVNIGIGGSDLGPAMACEALRPFHLPGFRISFVSNVDGAHLQDVLKEARAEETLFIIASKTFTTQETMINAHAAKAWFLSNGGDEAGVQCHFAAISTNIALATAFGVRQEFIFGFEDWVGGRYSVWSSIGLSLACAIGFDRFLEFLNGAHSADQHFRNTEPEKNIPVLMGLLGIWYRNFLDAETHAVLPYAQHLSKFPEWLQQVDMESNGKQINRDGMRVTYETGPVIWGAPGTNGQHAFFQLLHQGTSLIPCDFIAAARPVDTDEKQHQVLLSNFVAQTEALLKGKTIEEVLSEMRASGKQAKEIDLVATHRVFTGNKPSTTILVPKLDPYYLGMLMAMYEHKIFVQGIIWNIYSFDQWGVELGKVLAGDILKEMQAGKIQRSHDSSTGAILDYVINAGLLS